MPGIEPMDMYMLGKLSTTELHQKPQYMLNSNIHVVQNWWGLILCSRRKFIFNKNLFNVISKSSQHLSLSDIAWKEDVSFTSRAISAAVACQPLLLISLFPCLPFYWIHTSYFSSPFSSSCFLAFLWKYVVNTDRKKKDGTKGLANNSCFLNKGRNGSGVLLCLLCFALLLKEGQNINAWQQGDCTDFFFFYSFI